ncbi:hypothetical protein H5P28_12370 [Ruficoccus amylovorans]|uniref:Quinol:cytochrome C oxidoreductase n=1 Tax=Ruficoccus amylovorans TaxID=1804625 RepID=A0A842HEV3_9BACT|nr:hypothetical protein [Ruficoccus amylovorans]MBC2595053.1 hypothetical protein [Ruficoccus amylovorans]
MSSNAATASVPAAAAASGGRKPLATIFLIIGILGLVVALVGMVMGLSEDTPNGRPVMSWLVGYTFWFGMLIGMLLLVQISYIFDAGWSTIIRRQLEHFLAAFPWMFLLLIPMVALPFFVGDNPGALWKWMNLDNILPGAHPVRVGDDPLYLHKAGLLNLPFFIVRLCIYFAIFCGLSRVLRKHSFTNDLHPDPKHYIACRKWSGAGLFLTPMALTFAAFDLLMSLSYHWFSTMYGVWFFAVSMRIALAVIVITLYFLSTRGRLKGILNESHFYMLGCIFLAFTIFWAYISFSQFFLIYNANIPEETFWYNMRQLNADGTYNQWWWVGLSLIFCMFLFPFLFLLRYKNKVIPRNMVFISVWILVFAVVDLYFNIVPTAKPADNILGFYVTPFLSGYMFFDLAALIGVGGIVLWAALRSMATTYPIPIHDPRIRESIASVQ